MSAAKPGHKSGLTPPAAPAVFLQDRVGDQVRQKRFSGLLGEIRCAAPEELDRAIARVDEERAKGHHVAGFISYEAGYLLEPKLQHLLPDDRDVPLLWMGIFKTLREDLIHLEDFPTEQASFQDRLEDLSPELGEDAYHKQIDRIRAYIEAGDIYQANFTFQTDLKLSGHPFDYFLALTQSQPVPYAAYIDTGEEVVLSLSPELFFERRGTRIISKPMKGTARRGRTNEEDEKIAAALAKDPKERAENLMILDLVRNDLSRVAFPGSVKAPTRFSVERYRTVHQMVSHVEAKLEAEVTFSTLINAIFPCGSITGAPKVRAMEIIRELEPSPRGVYCGAIGHVEPSGDATFNVAIRTLTFKQDQTVSHDKAETPDQWKGRIGVGGGIVYDSTPQGEYRECQIKLAFLTRQSEGPFKLIETLKRQNDGTLGLLSEHLARLSASAEFFDFKLDRAKLRADLLAFGLNLGPGDWRLRLTLDPYGRYEFEAVALHPTSETEMRFALCDTPVDSNDAFLYHKTTCRALYDNARRYLLDPGGPDEVLFFNERGEATEGTISNLFIETGGRFLTPPVSAGLLNGTLRAHLLTSPSFNFVEATITREDIFKADAIYFGNSVRGLQKARLWEGNASLAGK